MLSNTVIKRLLRREFGSHEERNDKSGLAVLVGYIDDILGAKYVCNMETRALLRH